FTCAGPTQRCRLSDLNSVAERNGHLMSTALLGETCHDNLSANNFDLRPLSVSDHYHGNKIVCHNAIRASR
ncbi:hypothetical protein E4T56_gene16396, partial [Termitomyces sp. T112]